MSSEPFNSFFINCVKISDNRNANLCISSIICNAKHLQNAIDLLRVWRVTLLYLRLHKIYHFI